MSKHRTSQPCSDAGSDIAGSALPVLGSII
jgi:hypothetical protein